MLIGALALTTCSRAGRAVLCCAVLIRGMVDIPRIKSFAQRRYRANWSFVDGHYLASVNIDQTQMDRDRNRLRSVYRLKFMHNVVDMVINRSFADTQDYGNVP
jgi:prepilin-type processing-associated H-X9-DG protein